MKIDFLVETVFSEEAKANQKPNYRISKKTQTSKQLAKLKLKQRLGRRKEKESKYNHSGNIILFIKILLLTRLIKSCTKTILYETKLCTPQGDYVTSYMIVMVPIIIVSNFSCGMGQ